MSNHHSQKSINLHHEQVNAGKLRRKLRMEERLNNYVAKTRQLRFEYNFMLVCGFICFAYTAFATSAYLGLIF